MSELSEVYFFKDLNEQEMAAVTALARVRTCTKGELIVEGGKALDHFYIIREGRVALTVTMDKGDEMVKADEEILGHLESGECFGEFSLLDRQPASANVVAESNLVLYEIDRSDLLKLFEENHGVCRNVLMAMLRTVVGRLRKTDKDLVMTRYFERMR